MSDHDMLTQAGLAEKLIEWLQEYYAFTPKKGTDETPTTRQLLSRFCTRHSIDLHTVLETRATIAALKEKLEEAEKRIEVLTDSNEELNGAAERAMGEVASLQWAFSALVKSLPDIGESMRNER